MCRKAPTPAVDAFRLLDALWVHFSAFVIDDEEMQTRCFEEARKLLHPCRLRGEFRLGDDVMRYASAHRELALAQIGDGTRGPEVPICRKLTHELSVTYSRSPRALSLVRGVYRNRACGQPAHHSKRRFALLP